MTEHGGKRKREAMEWGRREERENLKCTEKRKFET
jgi:hypothetical protein